MNEIKAGPVIVDYWRQLDLFSPEKFGDKEVHVVGVGATGSYVAYQLAKMGVKNIHVWDFDDVEPHNLPNQIYRLKDVGRPKVDALAEIIAEATGIEIATHNEAVAGGTQLKGIVFLLVDSMNVRKDIWQGSLKFKLPVELMIETRMAIDNGRIYAIKPSRPADIKLWEGTLYSDEEAEESPCTNRSIAPTVSFIASIAVWKLIKFTNGEEYEREMILSARPSMIIGS
jgi:2,4-dienoyl-CoA reductase-like NADH-dependent reductase (Old Yellow Enzyme family)